MNISFPGFGVLAAALVIGTGAAYAQAPQDTGGACIPVAERAGRPYGCFIHASTPVGALDTAQAVWHLETFPTVDAAAKARTARGLVVEAFDKVWLLTIAPAGFRSPGGTQVAGIRTDPRQGRHHLRRAVPGGDLQAGHEVEGPSPLWPRSLVHTQRRGVPRDARRHDGESIRSRSSHRARWPSDGADRHGFQHSVIAGADSPRRQPAAHITGVRLDAEGPLQGLRSGGRFVLEHDGRDRSAPPARRARGPRRLRRPP